MRFGYPVDVREALAEILEIACLSMRAAARQGDARYCVVEANHIHNLPGLLKKFEVRRLKYYLDVERAAYIEALKEIPGATAEPYRVLWDQLERYAA